MPAAADTPSIPTPTSRARWKAVLLMPYLGLLFPLLYAHNSPTLFGFPFFYWYQFAWVVLSSILMAIVYRKLRY